MRKRFKGELSEVLAQDIEDHVELCSSDERVVFDKTPAQVCRYLTHFAHA